MIDDFPALRLVLTTRGYVILEPDGNQHIIGWQVKCTVRRKRFVVMDTDRVEYLETRPRFHQKKISFGPGLKDPDLRNKSVQMPVLTDFGAKACCNVEHEVELHDVQGWNGMDINFVTLDLTELPTELTLVLGVQKSGGQIFTTFWEVDVC